MASGAGPADDVMLLVTGPELWPTLGADDAAAPLMGRTVEGRDLRRGAALAVLDPQAHEGSPLWLIGADGSAYAATTTVPAGTVFLRAGEVPVGSDAATASRSEALDATTTAALRALHERFGRRLTNHNLWHESLVTWSPEEEFEFKLELPATATPWSVSAAVRQALAAGRLGPMIAHLRQEACRWDYECHLHEILHDGVSQGYVSLIAEDGAYQVKEKRFTADSVARHEDVSLGVAIADVEAYLADRFAGETLRALPPFRRIRYDVDLESLETGNHFVVSTDLCLVLSGADATLRQCEVEYVDTRAVLEPREVLSELEALRDQVHRLLLDEGLRVTPTLRSKLTFAREVADREQASRPAGTVGVS